jgi:hypothetical protein
MISVRPRRERPRRRAPETAMNSLRFTESPRRPLEDRISAALTDHITSSDLKALIGEAQEAIIAADASAEHERARALDLVISPDATQARDAMENAAFTRDRLRTVLPRLQARLKVVEAAEYLVRWEPDFKRVEAQRDALASEMRETYPVAVAQLIPLPERIESGGLR